MLLLLESQIVKEGASNVRQANGRKQTVPKSVCGDFLYTSNISSSGHADVGTQRHRDWAQKPSGGIEGGKEIVCDQVKYTPFHSGIFSIEACTYLLPGQSLFPLE